MNGIHTKTGIFINQKHHFLSQPDLPRSQKWTKTDHWTEHYRQTHNVNKETKTETQNDDTEIVNYNKETKNNQERQNYRDTKTQRQNVMRGGPRVVI